MTRLKKIQREGGERGEGGGAANPASYSSLCLFSVRSSSYYGAQHLCIYEQL